MSSTPDPLSEKELDYERRLVAAEEKAVRAATKLIMACRKNSRLRRIVIDANNGTKADTQLLRVVPFWDTLSSDQKKQVKELVDECHTNTPEQVEPHHQA